MNTIPDLCNYCYHRESSRFLLSLPPCAPGGRSAGVCRLVRSELQPGRARSGPAPSCICSTPARRPGPQTAICSGAGGCVQLRCRNAERSALPGRCVLCPGAFPALPRLGQLPAVPGDCTPRPFRPPTGPSRPIACSPAGRTRPRSRA